MRCSQESFRAAFTWEGTVHQRELCLPGHSACVVFDRSQSMALFSLDHGVWDLGGPTTFNRYPIGWAHATAGSMRRRSKKGKGGRKAAFPLTLATEYWVLGTDYRPATAAAAFGATPPRFMLSILFSTDSMLVPVSTHASTDGCRLPSACITNIFVSVLAFFTI